MKKTIAVVLIFLLSFTIPISIYAVTDSENIRNPGEISLSKEATQIDDNLWEVELHIDGKNVTSTSDVVLVIDVSGSMNDNNKMSATKKAAKQFINNILVSKDSKARIAIVSFYKTATLVSDFKDFSSKSELLNSVDELYANGGTNMQAGLNRAYELLKNSSAENKTIVMLGDGQPTYSYKISDVNNLTYELLDEECYCYDFGFINKTHIIQNVPSFIRAESITCDYNSIVGKGSSYEVTTGFPKTNVILTCKDKETYSYDLFNNNGATTIWEATKIKDGNKEDKIEKDEIKIYSIALQADIMGSKVLKAISTDYKNGYYYDISSSLTDKQIEKELLNVFNAISSKIAYAAKDGYVIDPMGEWINLVSNVNEITVSQGSVELNDTKDQIKWTVGEIVEGKTAIMKYIVTLKDDAPINQDLYTNKKTTFYYLDYENKNQEKDFNIPTVRAKGGSINIHYYRVNDNGQPINADGEEVSNPSLAQPISETEIFVYNGSEILPYNISGYEISAHDIGGYIYNNYYIDEQVGKDEKVNVSVTASKPKRDIYFGYIMNEMDCSLTIKKSGETEENQSYIFEITVTNSKGEFLGYFYEVIQGNGSKKIENLATGTYTVREITDWSWQYGNTKNSVNGSEPESGESNQVALTTKSKDGIIEFSENITSKQWLTDDAYALNKVS